MRLSNTTWPYVEKYLTEKSIIILPIGATEQHGPTGLMGTDHLTSTALAKVVGENHNVLVAPPFCYGMSAHHMDFPGSMTLRPSTFIRAIYDLVEGLSRHGFKKFYYINGHGGNIAPLNTAFSEIQYENSKENLEFKICNWWRLPSVQSYEQEHFGDESGYHATVGEVSLTQFVREEAFENITPQNFSIEKPEHSWPLGPQQFRQTYPDGRMSSNPGLASKDHGERIFNLAVEEITREVGSWISQK